MAELIKAYPKDVSLIIEIPLKELEDFLDYLCRCEITFDGEKEPEFKAKVTKSLQLIKSFDEMATSVRNYNDAA